MTSVRTEAWPEPFPIGRVGGAWLFPDQTTIYTQATAEVANADDVHALFDFFDWIEPHFHVACPPILVHDWRTLRSVPRDARSAFTWRRRKVKHEPSRVVVALTMNPLLRMTIQTAAMGAQIFARSVPLTVVADPVASLRELGVTDPDATLHARLRIAWQRSRT